MPAPIPGVQRLVSPGVAMCQPDVLIQHLPVGRRSSLLRKGRSSDQTRSSCGRPLCIFRLAKPGRRTRSSAPCQLMVADAIGEQTRCCEIFGAGETAGGASGTHERKLMLRVEVIEIHGAAPLRKRERDGLSAKDAYIAIVPDSSLIGFAPSIYKHCAPHLPCSVARNNGCDGSDCPLAVSSGFLREPDDMTEARAVGPCPYGDSRYVETGFFKPDSERGVRPGGPDSHNSAGTERPHGFVQTIL